MIQTKNKQPIKEISHQDIYALYDYYQSMNKIEELLEELRNCKKILWDQNTILLDSEGETEEV